MSYALGLVDCAVTVVVHSVIRDLGRSGIDLRVAVVAVALGCGKAVGVRIDAGHYAVAVLVHIVARDLVDCGVDSRVVVVAVPLCGGKAVGVRIGWLGVAAAARGRAAQTSWPASSNPLTNSPAGQVWPASEVWKAAAD